MDESPLPIGSAFEVDLTNVSIALIDSSTPRGSLVVPLVKTMEEVLSTSGAGPSQTVFPKSWRPFIAAAR